MKTKKTSLRMGWFMTMSQRREYDSSFQFIALITFFCLIRAIGSPMVTNENEEDLSLEGLVDDDVIIA